MTLAENDIVLYTQSHYEWLQKAKPKEHEKLPRTEHLGVVLAVGEECCRVLWKGQEKATVHFLDNLERG